MARLIGWGRANEDDGRELAASRMALAITTVVLVCFAFVAILNMQALEPSGAELAGSLACLAIVLVMQTIHSATDLRRWPPRQWMLTLSLQGVASYLPLWWLGELWGGMAGFLAGSVLLAMHGWWRSACFAAIVLSVLLIGVLLDMTAIDAAYLTVSTILTGLIIYGLRRMALLIVEVHASRGELARLAVTRERLRVARDLHDLLGYSLSAITLKAELVHRLLPRNPELSRAEVADLLGIARQALHDVRLVASGYRDMSLAAEADSAVSMLATADIEAELDLAVGTLPQAHDTVLATVLREAITNLLRHSKAQRCVIRATRTADTIRLEVRNDGVIAVPEGHSPGSGLQNLGQRLADIDGHLSVSSTDGWFELVAEFPAS